MDPRIAPLADILRLNTTLFRNCLDGLTDEKAVERPSPVTNSAAFIAAHVTDSRFYLLRMMGVDQPSPLAPYLDGKRNIDEIKQLPPLAEVQGAWTMASHAIRDRLDAMTAADLERETATKFPMSDKSVLAVLTFLVQHDSYHVGQLSLLRKHAGLPAMRYT